MNLKLECKEATWNVNGVAFRLLHDGNEKLVACVNSGHKDSEAWQRLFLAAPKLLEALKALRIDAVKLGYTSVVLNQVDAAVAAATAPSAPPVQWTPLAHVFEYGKWLLRVTEQDDGGYNAELFHTETGTKIANDFANLENMVAAHQWAEAQIRVQPK